MQTEGNHATVQPWLLRGPRVPAILFNMFITPAQFRDELNTLRAKNHMAPLDAALSAENLMRSALVMVRAKMVGRGAPGDLANMYKMGDPEARQWLKAFEAHRPSAGDSSDRHKREVRRVVFTEAQGRSDDPLSSSSGRSSRLRRTWSDT